MKPSDVFVRVIYGQGGKGPFSYGFIRFADRLRDMGFDVADDILWKYPDALAEDIRGRKNKYVTGIGYSLGANALSWMAERTLRTIDLLVGYDASDGVWPIIPAAPLDPIPPSVKRAMCYYVPRGIPPWGTPDLLGHAKFTGANVEVIPWINFHATICYDEKLHKQTLVALGNL